MHLVLYRKDIALGLLVADKRYGLLPAILPKWKYCRINSDELQIPWRQSLSECINSSFNPHSKLILDK